MWTDEFEAVLKRHCRFTSEDARLDPDIPMTLLGVDSMEIISLIVDLESVIGAQIPEDALTPQAFATPGALWDMLNHYFRPSKPGAATWRDDQT